MKTKAFMSATILICLLSSVSYADEHKWVGVKVSAGVPEGISAGLLLSPLNWASVHGSYTNNFFASGGKFGLTIDPVNFGVAPTLTSEWGFSSQFDLSKTFATKIKTFAYEYVNIHPGLEFGKRNSYRIFLRGGVSFVTARSYQFGDNFTGENFKLSNPYFSGWVAGTFSIGCNVVIF